MDNLIDLGNIKNYNNKILPNVKILNNGLTLVHVENVCKDIFRIELVLRAGTLQQTSKEVGFAHLIEHLMSFYPSLLRKDKKEYLESGNLHSPYTGSDGKIYYPNSTDNQQNINELGINMNAWTSDHTCGYWMEGLDDYSGQMVDWLFKNLLHPFLDKKVFKQEKNAVLRELSGYIDDIWYNFNMMLQYVLFKDTNMEYTIEYEKQNVKDCANIKNIFSFRKKWYKPEYITIIITSKLQGNNIKEKTEFREELFKYIEETYYPETARKPKVNPVYKLNIPNPKYSFLNGKFSFGGVRMYYIPGQQTKQQQTKQQQTKQQQTKQQQTKQQQQTKSNDLTNYRFFYIKPRSDTKQYKISLLFPVTFDPFDDRIFTVDYLTLILTEGLGSRLYYALRTILGAVYNVKASCFLDPLNSNYSYFSIDTECSGENIIKLIDYILLELQMLSFFPKTVEEYITKREQKQYKDSLKLIDNQENCSVHFDKHTNFYNERIIWNKKPFTTIDQEKEMREKVNPEMVQKLAQEIFIPERMRIFYSGENDLLNIPPNKKIHLQIKEKDFKIKNKINCN